MSVPPATSTWSRITGFLRTASALHEARLTGGTDILVCRRPSTDKNVCATANLNLGRKKNNYGLLANSIGGVSGNLERFP
jgi:hypothetical protein